ncbi:MAG: c-type cytochrome [Nitrospinota bacterium]
MTINKFFTLYIISLVLLYTASPAYSAPPKITKAEMKKASKIYFDRCTGCHGTLRKGATGPALTPKAHKKNEHGTEILAGC